MQTSRRRCHSFPEAWPSGRRHSPAKGACAQKRASTVRIRPPPPSLGHIICVERAMADDLQKYWTKRNFGITSEPKGVVTPPGKALSFVIQKHAARRLHYDFRLELDGTLKS